MTKQDENRYMYRYMYTRNSYNRFFFHLSCFTLLSEYLILRPNISIYQEADRERSYIRLLFKQNKYIDLPVKFVIISGLNPHLVNNTLHSLHELVFDMFRETRTFVDVELRIILLRH